MVQYASVFFQLTLFVLSRMVVSEDGNKQMSVPGHPDILLISSDNNRVMASCACSRCGLLINFLFVWEGGRGGTEVFQSLPCFLWKTYQYKL